jgi:hypothetical protein
MSRSKKKAIIKDNPSNKVARYWRAVRRVTNQEVREFKKEDLEDVSCTDEKVIVNDYDYCDYIIDYENKEGWSMMHLNSAELEKRRIKYSRK